MIYASDLLGSVVRTEAGDSLGRVHDLHAERTQDERWRLTGLVVGKRGLVARLIGGGAMPPGHSLVPWQDVVELGDGVVTVRR
jgi:sporulation protein YlmC with PRC-barrel domain